MDNLSREDRSRAMGRVRSRGTGPELAVRRALRALKVRSRWNRADLPGSPDLVLPELKIAVFVHGCFWHGHRCKKGRRLPATRRGYWLPKLARNKERDAAARRKLRAAGWRVVTVWECWTREGLEERLRGLLGLGDSPRRQ